MKNYIADIERALYDVRDEDKSIYKSDAGLTEEIIRDISQRKKDPPWMLEFRLKSLETYRKISLPTWGPDISELNMDEIVTYVKPNAKQVDDWSQVPDEIKNTFDRLGIPDAEKKSLAGVGAQ
ncbi:MAG: Fe-S cluster assembly protein SufB, partial [Selenomonadaceae bacterium]|nr:Fe-S cluster assembly protein SufB [Selenomonadaceae bacterium]